MTNNTAITYTLERLTSVNYPVLKEELLELYLHSFTTGEYAQYVSRSEASEKLDEIQRNGSGVVAMFQEKTAGALMGVPLASDSEFPAGNHPEILLPKTVYIAELMVYTQFRGQGIASALINHFLIHETSRGITDAVIRVWSQNLPAVRLYQKLGFRHIDEIIQTKYKSEVESFKMHKIYLHKKLQ